MVFTNSDSPGKFDITMGTMARTIPAGAQTSGGIAMCFFSAQWSASSIGVSIISKHRGTHETEADHSPQDRVETGTFETGSLREWCGEESGSYDCEQSDGESLCVDSSLSNA